MQQEKKGKNNPLFGSNHSEETKEKIRKARGTTRKVLDRKTAITQTFTSIRQSAKALACNETMVRNYIKSKKLYKARYQIEKTT